MTRDQIVGAALVLVERDGLDQLSMRKLAGALEVGTMSIYVYFADKDDLLDAMVRSVLAQMRLVTGPTWRDVLTTWATETRRVLLEHRALIPLMVSPSRPDLLGGIANAVLDALHRLGIPDAEAARYARVVGRYLTGAVVLDGSADHRRPERRSTVDADFVSGLGAVLAGLAPAADRADADRR